MTTVQLAALIMALLIAGVLTAHRVTRWVAGRFERHLALAIGVSVWTIAAGLLPFTVFGAVVRAGTSGPLGGFESFVFNLLPFVLLGAPLAGFAQGMIATKR